MESQRSQLKLSQYALYLAGARLHFSIIYIAAFAKSWPWSAALRSHIFASVALADKPLQSRCMPPMLYCASARPCFAALWRALWSHFTKRLLVISRRALVLAAHESSVELRIYLALLCSLVVPSQRLLVVLRHARPSRCITPIANC